LNLRHRSEAKSRIAEGHAGQFCFEFFALGWVRGRSEAAGQREKPLFFCFFGREADLDQFDEDSVGAGLLGFGEGFNPSRDSRWKRNALADGFVCIRHKAFYTSLHQDAPEQRTRNQTGRLTPLGRAKARPYNADDYTSGVSPTLK